LQICFHLIFADFYYNSPCINVFFLRWRDFNRLPCRFPGSFPYPGKIRILNLTRFNSPDYFFRIDRLFGLLRTMDCYVKAIIPVIQLQQIPRRLRIYFICPFHNLIHFRTLLKTTRHIPTSIFLLDDFFLNSAKASP